MIVAEFLVALGYKLDAQSEAALQRSYDNAKKGAADVAAADQKRTDAQEQGARRRTETAAAEANKQGAAAQQIVGDIAKVSAAEAKRTDLTITGGRKVAQITQAEALARAKAAGTQIVDLGKVSAAEQKHTAVVQTEAQKRAAATKDEQRAQARLEREAAREQDKRSQDRLRLAGTLTKAVIGVAAGGLALGGYGLLQSVSGLEGLHFSAQRSGADPARLNSLAYALSRMGVDGGQAQAVTEQLAQRIRQNSGAREEIEGLGVRTRDAQGRDVDRSEIFRQLPGAAMRTLKHRGAVEETLQRYGYSVEVIQALLDRGAELDRRVAEDTERQRQIRLNVKTAASSANSLMDAFSSIQRTFALIFQHQAGSGAGGAVQYLQELDEYLKQHAPEIDAAASGVMKVIGDLLKTGVDFFKELDKDAAKREAFVNGITGVAKAVVGVKDAIKSVDDFGKETTGQSGFLTILEAYLGFKVLSWAANLGKFTGSLNGLLGVLQLLSKLPLPVWLMTTFAGIAAEGGIRGEMKPGDTISPRNLARQIIGPEASREGQSPPPPIADRVGRGVAPKDDRKWYQKILPNGWGGKDAPAAHQSSLPEGDPGTYRPQYKLSDADLDQRVINTIAGEASANDPAAVDAVINNMFNRLGTTAWGPARNLHDVASADGQYAGYNKGRPSAAQAEMIRNRIRAIASGAVPDNTEGSNSFRSESYYRGEGANKTWARTSKIGPNVGGNRYAVAPGIANGPYGSYAKPQSLAEPALKPGEYIRYDPRTGKPASIESYGSTMGGILDSIGKTIGVGSAAASEAQRSTRAPWQGGIAPALVPSPSVSNDNSRGDVNVAPNTTFNVYGSIDGALTEDLRRKAGRVNADIIRNAQGAFR